MVTEPEQNGRSERTDRSDRPGAPLFETRIERTESLTYVELLGELDLSCVDRYADAVDSVQAGRLVLDLRGLTFIDSMGLRMILGTWKRSRDQGFALEIVSGRDQVEKVFRITGLDHTLPVVHQISLNGHSQTQQSLKTTGHLETNNALRKRR